MTHIYLKMSIVVAIIIGFAHDSHLPGRSSLKDGQGGDVSRPSEKTMRHSPQSSELSLISSALAASDDKVFALTADNTLLAFGASGASPADLRLASPPPAVPMFAEHLLATNRNQNLLYVLVMADAQSHQSVAVVDTAEVKILKLIPVADGTKFRCIAIGARTGHIYLTGNQVRTSRAPQKSPNNPTVGNPVVWDLDANDGTVLHKWDLDVHEEDDWRVYQAEPSEDERNILVSYHGTTTTGIDSFEVAEGELVRCKDRKNSRSGCTAAHGGFVQMGDRLFAATGQPVILEYKSGTVQQVFNSELEGSHLMEFAVDRRRERIYAIGSCGFAGGFSVMKLSNGGQTAKLNADGWSWNLLGNPAPTPQILIKKREICGERVAVGSGSVIVIAQTHGPESLETRGALLFLDGDTAKTLLRLTPSSRLVGVAIIHTGRR